MFEIGWSEILVIAVVAIVVIGPKDLPRVMRIVGQWTGKMKRMAREFQGQFNEALREAELDDIKKEVESLGKLDPLKDVRKEIAAIDSSINDELAKPTTAAVAPKMPTEPPPKVEK
jgi:sec-independent protein translocase protein TatB